MNRVKLSITDDNGRTICKIGTSINPPQGLEYSDEELARFLHEMGRMLEAPQLEDPELDEFEPGSLASYLESAIAKPELQ